MFTLPFWIGLLIGLSTGFFLFNWILKKHFKNIATLRTATSELHQKKEDLRELISRVYHKDIFPETRRAIGIFQLIKMILQKSKENVVIAQRPDHYRYITLIEKEIDECIDLSEKGIIETTVLSDRFKTIIKKYEGI